MKKYSRGFADLAIIGAIGAVLVVGTIGTLSYRLKSAQEELAKANEAKANVVAETWKWKDAFDKEANAFETLKSASAQCNAAVDDMKKAGDNLNKQVAGLQFQILASQKDTDKKVADILHQDKPKTCDGATIVTLTNYQKMARQFSEGK